MGIEFTDESGKLRPAEDYRAALRYYQEQFVKNAAHAEDPLSVIHGIVAMDALKVLVAVTERAEKDALD